MYQQTFKTLKSIENIKLADGKQYKISIPEHGECTFRYYAMPSNCKYFHIDGVQSVMYTKGWKAILKVLLPAIKARSGYFAFSVTFNDKQYVERLGEVATLIGVNKVPIGYNDKYQYHCTYTVKNNRYNDRIKKFVGNNPNHVIEGTEKIIEVEKEIPKGYVLVPVASLRKIRACKTIRWKNIHTEKLIPDAE